MKPGVFIGVMKPLTRPAVTLSPSKREEGNGKRHVCRPARDIKKFVR